MSIIIDSAIPDFCMAKAGQVGVVARYQLPAAFGTGNVALLAVEPGLTMALRHLRLAEDLVLKRPVAPHQTEMLLLSIQAKKLEPEGMGWHVAATLVAPAEVAFTLRLPAQTDLFMVSLVAPKSLLRQWFAPLTGEAAVLLSAQTPVVHEVFLPADLQRLLLELTSASAAPPWENFFYRLKAQELVYLLFRHLAQRRLTPPPCPHPAELSAVSRVRDYLLASLATPPSLRQLAKMAGLSEAKLQKRFRQVFGTSVYQYYQAARMEEAKQRLTRLSVSEVGYQLGFVNLSHFTRLFTKHHGLRPKYYQTCLSQPDEVSG